MHGQEALVGDEWREVAHIAPDARKLEDRRVFLAGARTHWIVDRVVGVGERDLAVDDAGQRIRSLNSRPEADGLEEGLRGGAEGRDRRLAQRIGEADALEGMPLERIADGEVEARGGLVVVLRQRLLAPRSGWPRCAGRGLVVLGGVEVLLVVENLEADA